MDIAKSLVIGSIILIILGLGSLLMFINGGRNPVFNLLMTPLHCPQGLILSEQNPAPAEDEPNLIFSCTNLTDYTTTDISARIVFTGVLISVLPFGLGVVLASIGVAFALTRKIQAAVEDATQPKR